MIIKENEYKEIRNTDLGKNIPVKILKINEFDIKIKDLIENTEYKIYKVSQIGHPTKTPYINDKMIEGCGFKKNISGNYELNDIVIIECIPIIKQINLSKQQEFERDFYGHKILLKTDVNDFIQNNIETIHNTTLREFKTKNDTVFCVEDFCEKLIEFGVTNFDFEKLLIEQCKPF
ncbi:hypothetical protein ACFX5D_03355 [Flavobacterium sp. LB3P45]|uniref:Uncharacterized protein n=1 Tax=Flavobacterium fructosi TaxID=3230416 RepID=A0ABW6HJ02_9FLAO